MESNIVITQARHAWPEPDGFTISRPRGIPVHTFLHFFNSVELLVNGKTIITAPDACIFYAADTPQWFRSLGPLRHNWMHMTGDLSTSLKALGIPVNTPFFPDKTEFITDIHRTLEFELLTKHNNYQQLLQAKYQELLILLSRSCNEQPQRIPVRPTVEARLRQVRNLIFSQLDKHWTVEEMAALSYLSVSRFHTLYKQLFGLSPTDDLIHARMDMAKYRLSSTQNTITSISSALGYRNLTHFCRQFKQYSGLTPEQYRQSQNG